MKRRTFLSTISATACSSFFATTARPAGVPTQAQDAKKTGATEVYESSRIEMGSKFRILLEAPSRSGAETAFDKAFARIRQLNDILSDYDPESELSKLGAASPTERPVKVSTDLWTVLRTAQEISRQTSGAFDVTVGPLTRQWRRARRRKKIPEQHLLARAKQSVDYRHLQLDEATRAVRLLKPEMRLDLGGIAKGYAADEAKKVLKGLGIHRALIDAGGDLSLGNALTKNKFWKVGVAPLSPKQPPTQFLNLANCGVATSGDAWQYLELDGRRYSHVLDPFTGLGVLGRHSATVIAADCQLADAWASALTVMGPDKGLAIIEQQAGIEGMIVRVDNGKARRFTTKKFLQST